MIDWQTDAQLSAHLLRLLIVECAEETGIGCGQQNEMSQVKVLLEETARSVCMSLMTILQAFTWRICREARQRCTVLPFHTSCPF